MSSPTVSCAVCGTTVEAPPPLTWSTSTGPRGTVPSGVRRTTYACDACTRTHLRSMEAKLDEEFW